MENFKLNPAKVSVRTSIRRSLRDRDWAVRVQGALALVAFAAMLVFAATTIQPRPERADQRSEQHFDFGLAAGDRAVQAANRRSMPEPSAGPSAIRARGPVNSKGRDGWQSDLASGHDGAQAQDFKGTVVREGSAFMLRDPSGARYKLDANESAKAFEGRPVRVSGQLEESAGLIHVQEIEEPWQDAEPAPAN